MDIKNYTDRKPENLVQKVLQYEDNVPVEFPGYVSEKLDGVFALVIVHNNNVSIYSRTGKEYTSAQHLKPQLKEISNYVHKNVFIGELYTPGVDVNTISGYARDTKKQHIELKLYIHDVFTLEEFKAGKTQNTYAERNEILKHIANYFYFPGIVAHWSIPVENMQVLQNYAKMLINAGKEGVVYRNARHVWQAGKRNADMIKIKQELTIDLKIVDIVQGVGKCANTCGKIIAIDGENKRVAIGTGLNDEQRREFWEFRQYYSGAIITVKAMSISKNGVLRQPVFVCVRQDKITPDKISAFTTLSK